MKKPDGSLISYFSRLARETGSINLAQGKPGFSPPQELVDSLVKVSGEPSLHQYAPGIGNPKLLELLVQEYNNISPLSVENLLITQGATEGLFLTFFYLQRILDKPFSALSFDPVYEVYPKLAQYFDVPFLYFDIPDDSPINSERLKETCQQEGVKIIFLASPGNPLGRVWSREELEDLLNLCQQMNIYLIFDAVYKDIYFKQPPFNPLVLNFPFLFYVSSFSKMLSITGWRVGFIIATEIHIKKIRAIHDYIGLCAPSLEQQAIANYLVFRKGGRDYIKNIRAACQRNSSYLKDELVKSGFYVPPFAGGYFIWARIPEGFENGYSLAWVLLHKGKVGVVPGENFSKTRDNYIRLNFATDFKKIQESAKRIKEFVRLKQA